MDLDTLVAAAPGRVRLRDHHPGRLPEHRRRRTSSRSSAPPSYVLWRRTGPTPPLRVIDKDGTPGRVLDCASRRGSPAGRGRAAPRPCSPSRSRGGPAPGAAARPFDAPGTRDPEPRARARALAPLAPVPQPGAADRLGSPGRRWSCPRRSTGCTSPTRARERSGRRARFASAAAARCRSRWTPHEPSQLQRDLGVERQVWLGTLAATRPGASVVPLHDACGQYVDHFTSERGERAVMTATREGRSRSDSDDGREPARPSAAPRRPPGRPTRRRSCSSAAPGAAAPTCSPGCSAGTRTSRWSRSRSASTSRSAAFRGCSRAASRRSEFVRRLRGFWWKGLSDRAHAGAVTGSSPRSASRRRSPPSRRRFDDDPEAACRRLFYDLLWFRVERGGAPRAWSSRAPTRSPRRRRWCACSRRPSSSTWSATGATPPPRAWPRRAGLISPRTRRQGLEWWEERIRRVDAGARAIPPDRLLTVSLDELLLLGRSRGLRPLCRFVGVYRRTARCGASSAAA